MACGSVSYVSLNLDDILSDGYVRCFGKGHKERIIPVHQRAILRGGGIPQIRPSLVFVRTVTRRLCF